jgi:small redox-active disulfide protein 2
MNIKILGTGCTKCKKLERLVHKAVDELEIDADIEKVEDIQEIMKYNILSTPGLVIDGEVKLSGQLPKLNALKQIIHP